MSIALDHAAFDAALGDVRTAANELQEAHDRADRNVDGLLRGGWTGIAANSFAEAWADWRQAADGVLDELLTIRELLDAAHADLSGHDLDAQAALGHATTRLHDRLG
jgi:WXG100 family type VII secretion target